MSVESFHEQKRSALEHWNEAERLILSLEKLNTTLEGKKRDFTDDGDCIEALAFSLAAIETNSIEAEAWQRHKIVGPLGGLDAWAHICLREKNKIEYGEIDFSAAERMKNIVNEVRRLLEKRTKIPTLRT